MDGVNTSHKIEFPKFDGVGDPLPWFNRCERYFTLWHAGEPARPSGFLLPPRRRPSLVPPRRAQQRSAVVGSLHATHQHALQPPASRESDQRAGPASSRRGHRGILHQVYGPVVQRPSHLREPSGLAVHGGSRPPAPHRHHATEPDILGRGDYVRSGLCQVRHAARPATTISRTIDATYL
jgi:hypothetical protein